MKQKNLKNKVATGFFWIGIAYTTQRILTAISGIILARLLNPHDFGLMALALTTVAFTGILGSFGTKDALIYQKDRIQEAANTTFYLNIALGLFYASITFFLAPTLATFFNEPDAENIIRAMSLFFLFNYFGLTSMIMLQKEIEYFKKTIIIITTTVLSIASSIFLAMNGYGAWSLVIGFLVTTATSSILYFIICPWKPTLKLSKKTASELFHFSKHLLKSQIFLATIEHIDKFVLGKIKATSILGFYNQAYNFGYMPGATLTILMEEVTLPVFSKIKENKEQLTKAYLKNFHLMSVITIPTVIGITMLAAPITLIIFGEKWLPMVPALQIISFYGAFRTIATIAHDILKVTGNPKIFSNMIKIQALIMIVLIVPLTYLYSLEGTALALTIPTTIQSFLSHKKGLTILNQKSSELFKILGRTIAPSVILIITIAIFTTTQTINNVSQLAIITVLSIITYTSTTLLIDKSLIAEAKSFLARK